MLNKNSLWNITPRRLKASRPVIALLLSMLSFMVLADHKIIRYATVEEHPDSDSFYMEILEAAFERTEHSYELEWLGDIPQVRIQSMLKSGAVDVYWMIKNPDRNASLLPTNIGISGGLIGHRILMIRPEDQHLFDDVETLDEFRQLNLTVGFGRGWVDSLIWEANDLPFYEEEGSWHVIFDKLKRDRGDFDYLSRSVKELPAELERHPELAAEDNLMLVYERDETFYVSPQNEDFRDDLSAALRKIKEDGIIERMVERYWGVNLDLLNTGERTIIDLYTPPLDR